MGGYGQGVSDALYGGFQQGEALRQQKHQQEFLSTADQLFKNRDALQTKLSTLKDADGNPLPGYDDTMKALADNETAIRQHWHPDKNPGMLQKFGHMITDRLGITNADDRQAALDQKKQAAIAGDQSKAQALATAAPLSPAQVALQQAHTQGAVNAVQLQQAVDNFHKLNPDATPQQEAAFKKEISESLLLGRRWNPLMDRGKTVLMTGIDKDGNPVQFMHDAFWNRNTDVAGNPIDDDVITGLKDIKPVPTTSGGAGKSAGSAFNVWLDAYARAHNTTRDKLPFNAIQYVAGMMAQSRMLPSTTTSIVWKQGADNLWYPMQDTNTRTPGAVKLKDPLGGALTNWMAEGNAATAPSTTGTSTPVGTSTEPSSSATTPNHSVLKKEADARKPQPPASGSVLPGQNPRVHVGQPVLMGRSKASDAAQQALDAADTSYQEVLRAAHSTNPVDSQGVVMSWLKGKVNRVTATEIAQVQNLGGVFDKFDGKLSSIEQGTMTPKQMSWFVKNAKDNLDVARKVASKYTNPNGSSEGGNNSGGSWRDRAVPHTNP